MTAAPVFAKTFSLVRSSKLLWLLILALLWIVTLIVMPRVPTPQPAIDSKLLALRLLLCITLAVALANWRGLLRQRWQFADGIYLFLTAAFAFSTVFSSKFSYAIMESWQFGGLILVSWITSRVSPTPGDVRALLWTAGTLGVLASLYGLLTYVGLDPLRPLYPFDFEKDQAGGRNYIHSFFGNPEYFGGYAAPTAVILWGLAFQPHTKLYWRIIFSGLTAFVLLVLGLSGSRGAFLGFLAGAALVFLGQTGLLQSYMKKAAWSILGAGIILGIGTIAVLSTPNPLNPRDMRLFQRFTTLTDTQTASVRERLMFYTSTAAAIPEHPVFGYGPGTYRLEFLNNVKLLVDQDPRAGTVIMLKELDRRLAEHAHNDYLEIWFEQGTLGISAFLLLLTYIAVRFTKNRIRVRQFKNSAQILGTTGIYVTTSAGILAICVNALTSFPLHMPARATLAWLLIGAFFALDRRMDEAPAITSGIESQTTAPMKDEI